MIKLTNDMQNFTEEYEINFTPIFTDETNEYKKEFVHKFVFGIGKKLGINLTQVRNDFYGESELWNTGFTFEYSNDHYYLDVLLWDNKTGQHIQTHRLYPESLREKYTILRMIQSITHFKPIDENPWRLETCEVGITVDKDKVIIHTCGDD